MNFLRKTNFLVLLVFISQLLYSQQTSPVLLSASYQDTYGNGTVNHIDALYSEDITSSRFKFEDWSFPSTAAPVISSVTPVQVPV